MKLYVFNSTELWSVDVCHAVVADSEDKAREYFLSFYDPMDDRYSVKEVEIKPGLILEADGYDNCRMLVKGI